MLDLAAQVLGQGKTSRLYKRLVYKDQTATSATAFDWSNEIAGQFYLTLTAKPGGDLKNVEKAADEELQNFLKNGPSEAELQLAKTQIFGEYARIMERIGGFGGKSDILATCQTFTGNPACYKDYLQRIQAATPATVKKAANDWLTDGDYVLEVYPYPTNLKATSPIDRSQAPAPGSAMSLHLPPMQKATLANGLKIVLAERHTAPVVNFSLLVESGYAADPADALGTCSFAQRMLEEGTPTRDSLKIGEELESLSAEFSAGANLDYASVRSQRPQNQYGQGPGNLCRLHSPSRLPAEGVRALAEGPPGRHSAREGHAQLHGSARSAYFALRQRTSLRRGFRRHGHRIQREQDDPRGPRQIPRHLVQAQ